MAIIQDFEVTVSAHGEPCKEHSEEEDEDDPARTVSKYIEATPGAPFAIRFTVNPAFDFGSASHLRWEIFLDGKSVAKPLCDRRTHQRLGYYSEAHSVTKSGKDGSWTKQNFQFGNAILRDKNENDTCETIEAIEKEVATIKVVITRRAHPKQLLSHAADRPVLLDEILEKAVKAQAVSLCTSLGAPEPIRNPTFYELEDVDEGPIAEFTFKYRDQTALKQLRVIPRTPSPEPLEERKLDTLNPAEMRELIQKQKMALEAKDARIKQERVDANLHVMRLMKRTRANTPTENGDSDIEVVESGSVRKRFRPSAEEDVVELSD